MTDHYPDIDELLAKQLTGEATPEEVATVEDWLDDSAANRRYFADLQKIWHQADPPATHEVDTESALYKVKARLRRPELHATAGGRLPRWMLGTAAALAALLIAALFLLTPDPAAPREIAAGDAMRTDTLADGSIVALNRASALTVAQGYGRQERRLRLRGEAHFAVAPDATKPFVVEVQELEVRVVGTEFTVDNQSDPGRVVVAVASGTVELRAGAQTERLGAGEQAEYRIADGRIVRAQRADPNADAWRTQRFMFEARPLGEVVAQLEQAYGIDIVLKNPLLENCPLNGTYAEDKPERVLELIAAAFSLTFTREGEQFVLDGPNCGEE